MKKALLYLFLLLGFYSQAQHDYIPMAVENAQWTIFVSDDDYFPPFIEYYYGYRIQGDTIINGVSYKKVFRRHFSPVNPDLGNPLVGPFTVGSGTLYGAIRDDIPNKRIYGIQFCNTPPSDCPCNEEFLMYDFNMNVNDNYDYNTFCLFGYNSDYQIGELNNEFIFNDERIVQHIYYSSFDTDMRIYEGVGSSFGLFEVIGPILGMQSISLNYHCIGTDQECLSGFILGEDELFLDKKIKIYPNPVKNVITIENRQEAEFHIKIYDILGKLILTKKISNVKNTIDVSNLKEGIYLLQYNNTLYKVIKQ